MSVWVVRAGKHGEQEATVLDKNVIAIGWNELPDLSSIRTRDELRELYERTYPEDSENTVSTQVGQIWRFIHEINIGDLVCVPLRTQRAIAVGEVNGEYEYKPSDLNLPENVIHIRRVKWLADPIPRHAFDQDILWSFGYMTVSQSGAENAEERIKRLALGEVSTEPARQIGGEIEEETIDIEDYAKDLINKHIGMKFKGHELTRLVDAILRAQGYTTQPSMGGPDRGVDILASRGPLGFDEPKMCVQVKSTSSPVGAPTLMEFKGAMTSFDADYGLLVSWSGFTNDALREARGNFFNIRLWDSDDLLEAIFRHYERLDADIKAELPLKKIWTLVQEEQR